MGQSSTHDRVSDRLMKTHYLHGNAVFVCVLNETHLDAGLDELFTNTSSVLKNLVKAKHAGQIFAYNVGMLRQKARFQGAFLEIG